MSAFGGRGPLEQGGMENQVAYAKRRKSGLEVPLRGQIYGENKLLVFAPALWHDMLMFACILVGVIAAITGGGMLPGGLFTAFALLTAGFWAALSNERMICDLRARTYRRYEGWGPGKRSIRGSLNELEALVLTSEQYAHGTGASAMVFYRLVLYWKGQRHPPLVVEKERHFVSFGSPLNTAVQPMLYRGMRYAKALGVPYYDNSHLASKSPVPVL